LELMDFEAEAKAIRNALQTPFSHQWQPIADALRRAYEAGAADALVKGIDLAAGDDWAPVTQGGE
jgi:hypothetical protein